MYNSIRILPSAPYQTQGILKQHGRFLGRFGFGLWLACLSSLSIGIIPQGTFAQSNAPDATQMESETSDPTKAQTTPVPTAPAALTETLAQVDMAANQQDLSKLISFYDPEFVSGDGFNRDSLQQIIAAFWQDYQDLAYQTELISWEKNAQGYIVETKTTITGTQTLEQGPVTLQSTLHGRQHWVGNQITRQDLLAESSQLTSGRKPPKVQVNLPREVTVGEKFEFDVIVDEPLGDNPLLGLALEEPITIQNYLKQPPLKLELLPAGGLFKVGTAASKPMGEWISAILVQDGGITIISQRLNVVQKKQPVEQSRQ